MSIQERPGLKDNAVLAAKGAAIGAANTVPGVSGGTIAVLVGIYERLIAAVGGVVSREWKRSLLYVIPVGVGALIGIGISAGILDYAFERYPEQTAFLFMGLILGSLPFLYRQAQPLGAQKIALSHLLVFLAGAGALFVQAVVGEPGVTEPITEVTVHNSLVLFAAGVIAAATMVVPGVSGSFVLVVLGLYSTFLDAVRTLNIPVLIVLVVGAAVGIVAVSKLIGWLLSRYHRTTYWAISGLVVGSVTVLWPGIATATSGVLDVVTFVAGATVALLLGKR